MKEKYNNDYEIIMNEAPDNFKEWIMQAIKINILIEERDSWCYSWPNRESIKHEIIKLNKEDKTVYSLFLAAIITNKEVNEILSQSGITEYRVKQYAGIHILNDKFKINKQDYILNYELYFKDLINKLKKLNNVFNNKNICIEKFICDLYLKDNCGTDIINWIYKYFDVIELDSGDAFEHESYNDIQNLPNTKLNNEQNTRMKKILGIKNIRDVILKLEQEYNKKLEIDCSTFIELIDYILNSKNDKFLNIIIRDAFQHSKGTVTIKDVIIAVLNCEYIHSKQKEQMAVAIFNNWYPTLK